MSEKLLRKRLVFEGLVQGVGFRWRARHAAEAVGATGWVQNNPDGMSIATISFPRLLICSISSAQ